MFFHGLFENEIIFMLLSAQKSYIELLMVLSCCGTVYLTDKGFQYCAVQSQLCSVDLSARQCSFSVCIDKSY